MGTGVDRKYARDHAAKLLDDQLAGDFQDSIYAPVMFGPSGGPFGPPSSAVKRKKNGIPRLRDMPVRMPADRFVAHKVPEVGGGILLPEEMGLPAVPRKGSGGRGGKAEPLLPYQTAEEYRRNCAAIDPANTNISIVPRDRWTNAKPRGEMEAQENAYDTVTFHHTGRQRTAAAVAGLHLGTGIDGLVEHSLRNTNNLFSRNKLPTYDDFADIGYHFLIGKDGTVYEGRPVANVGAHVKGDNRRNLGVAFLGDYTDSPVTDAQLQAAYNLTEIARKGAEVKRVATHGEFDSRKASELKGAIAQLRCLVR